MDRKAIAGELVRCARILISARKKVTPAGKMLVSTIKHYLRRWEESYLGPKSGDDRWGWVYTLHIKSEFSQNDWERFPETRKTYELKTKDANDLDGVNNWIRKDNESSITGCEFEIEKARKECADSGISAEYINIEKHVSSTVVVFKFELLVNDKMVG